MGFEVAHGRLNQIVGLSAERRNCRPVRLSGRQGQNDGRDGQSAGEKDGATIA
jgi:hypothetical protein